MDERRMQQGSRLEYDHLGQVSWEAGRPVPSAPTESIGNARARTEGPRSMSTRTSVMLRYVAYFLTVLLCSGITNAFLSAASITAHGGSFMLFSATLMFATAAVATILFPNSRRDILGQMRHYVFGLSVLPGTAIAGIIWALHDMLNSASSSSDTMSTLMGFAIPIVFFTTVIIPPVIFVKAVAGYYSLNRSRMSDAEMMALYNRQDPLQR